MNPDRSRLTISHSRQEFFHKSVGLPKLAAGDSDQMEPTLPALLTQAFSGANLSQVTCSTGLEPGINDHGSDAEVVEAGSDCGGPDHGGQDVRPGGFRSQGPRLFHQPPSPLLPTPCTSCNTLDGRWRTFSRLGVALWQSPRRRKRRLRVSWLLSVPCSPLLSPSTDILA